MTCWNRARSSSSFSSRPSPNRDATWAPIFPAGGLYFMESVTCVPRLLPSGWKWTLPAVSTSPPGKEPPGDELVLALVDDFGIPFDIGAESALRFPVRVFVVEGFDVFQVSHDLRQIVQVSPELIEFFGRLVDDDCAFEFEPFLRGDGGARVVVGGVDAEGFVALAVSAEAAPDEAGADGGEQQARGATAFQAGERRGRGRRPRRVLVRCCRRFVCRSMSRLQDRGDELHRHCVGRSGSRCDWAACEKCA